ncbi:DUF4388 domain-containing protein [Desulfonauticus submarinus]
MLKGEIGSISLISLVQLCCQDKKSGRLLLFEGGDKIGEIVFQKGEIIAARKEELKGEEAFFQLLNLREGEFVFETESPTLPREINMSCEHLLLEALRKQDEVQSSIEAMTFKLRENIEEIVKVSPARKTERFFSLCAKISSVLAGGKIKCVWLQGKDLVLLLPVENTLLEITASPKAVVEELLEKIEKVLEEE